MPNMAGTSFMGNRATTTFDTQTVKLLHKNDILTNRHRHQTNGKFWLGTFYFSYNELNFSTLFTHFEHKGSTVRLCKSTVSKIPTLSEPTIHLVQHRSYRSNAETEKPMSTRSPNPIHSCSVASSQDRYFLSAGTRPDFERIERGRVRGRRADLLGVLAGDAGAGGAAAVGGVPLRLHELQQRPPRPLGRRRRRRRRHRDRRRDPAQRRHSQEQQQKQPPPPRGRRRRLARHRYQEWLLHPPLPLLGKLGRRTRPLTRHAALSG